MLRFNPNTDPTFHATCERWFAAKATKDKPYEFIPTQPFTFGGKQFVAGVLCKAFATRNFGWIVQGKTFARE